jgi:4-amino-4-deoxy-L-arabinose transferase-like glycosyltransferase
MLYEFYAQNLERSLTSENRGHAQPVWYFLRNFWLDFSPWSWLFPAAIAWLIHSKRWQDPKVQLALWWFGTFFVFLSIAATKRQLYLLPAYPAVALLLGPWLATVGRADNSADSEVPSARPVRIYSAALAAVYIILGVVLIGVFAKFGALVASQELNSQEIQVAESVRWPLLLLAATLLVSGVVVGLAWRGGKIREALVRIGVSQVALYVVLLAVILPTLEPTKTYQPQSQWISDQIGNSAQFGMVDPAGVGRRGGFSYYTGTMVPLLTGPSEVESFLQQYPESVVLVIEGSVDEIFAGNEPAWRERIRGEVRVGSHLYVVVGSPTRQ